TRSKRDWSSDVCSSDLCGGWATARSSSSVGEEARCAVDITHPPLVGSHCGAPQGQLSLPVIHLSRTKMTPRQGVSGRDAAQIVRSEERRVGKEGRAGRA